MTGFTVRTASDRWTLGYEGENNSRTLRIKTMDDLTDFDTVNLLIDTLDCGAMTVTTVGNFKVLSMVLTAAMLGEAGKKTCQLLMMDSEGTVIKKTNQFCMVVGRSNVIEGTVPDSERIVIITDYIEEKVGELLGDYENAKDTIEAVYVYAGKVMNGGLNTSGLPDTSNTKRLVSEYIPITPGTSYKIKVEPAKDIYYTFMEAVSFYTANDYATARTATLGGWSNGNELTFTAPNDVSYMRVLMKTYTNDVLDFSMIKLLTVTECGADSFVENYAIDSSFIKRGLNVVALGVLSRAQAVCKYDGKYYSANGDGITVQDTDFTVVQAYPLSLGHANSFHVGSGNKGYVSGWDDNTIYVIDMDTVTIESTISLPTTGYTTGAVDDVNGIAYIFQRDSYPSTMTNYNFIAYDYVNEQILFTKKTTVSFAAMQAVDFINGLIFVVNGSGTVDKPNGFRVYNTNGDAVGEYVLGGLSTLEPEGVFLDRESRELYISDVHRVLYRLDYIN